MLISSSIAEKFLASKLSKTFKRKLFGFRLKYDTPVKQLTIYSAEEKLAYRLEFKKEKLC